MASRQTKKVLGLPSDLLVRQDPYVSHIVGATLVQEHAPPANIKPTASASEEHFACTNLAAAGQLRQASGINH